MSGIFGVATKEDCFNDVFFGTDYHSHLGTRRAGIAIYDGKTFNRAIHNIETAPFRSKFQKDIEKMHGNMAIGCISDYEPQPLLIKSHHGTYAITTVSKINNAKELEEKLFKNGHSHFLEMSGGDVNPTELVASLINQKENLIDGIKYALDSVDGSLSLLILNEKGIYAARDKYGRTPIVVGKREDGYCLSFESFAFLNLGFSQYKELGPGEICVVDNEKVTTLVKPGDKMKICTFLWVYYGYPPTSYEGLSVEKMRCNCGRYMAQRDNVEVDSVAGVPDSGIAHAVGYANESGVPFQRPFIKYTPTWPRSFMPPVQSMRNLIAKMKLVPVHDLIKGKRLLLIDDSIVRGTQMRETTEFLYKSGAKEVHIRAACPPLLFGCKYLNFSRSTSENELVARRIINKLEGKDATREEVKQYVDPDGAKYKAMVDGICKELNFTSLGFNRLDDLKKACEIDPDKLSTNCWTGEE